MKQFFTRSVINITRYFLTAALLLTISTGLIAQTTTNTVIPSGSFIVNMGIVPQTVANGLKPYGMVYALLKANCPVEWVINPTKAKDGTDFTYNGVAYKGGTFIIKAEFRTAAVNSIISLWQTYGVQGITTTSPMNNIPVYLTMWNAPKWTMDLRNGGIATGFFANAGIPASAYGGASTFWKTPAQLDCCDDIFVMPHADPIWLTHRRLWEWVGGTGPNSCKGGVWLGCHAGSALENMFDNITTDGDPIDLTQQTNFLSEKSGPAVGAGPYSTPGNSLILWGSHDDGTLPYTYNSSLGADPVGQYMGAIDAALLNGSEQIYIPVHTSAGWRPLTKVLVYDPDHPDAKNYPSTPMTHVGSVLAYGPGFGEETNGKVMLEAGHNIAGTAPANVAAQRAFFNYSFLVAWEKAVLPTLSNLPTTVYSGMQYELSYGLVPNVPGTPIPNFTTVWSATCGGSFLPNNTSPTVIYIPPTSVNPISCNISVTITDNCGRTTFDTHSTLVSCDLQVATTLTNPCYGSSNGGAINMTFTNGSGPYNYSWTKSGGGSGSGTLTTAPYTISDLSAGTYTVNITSGGGTGCPASFTVTLTESPQINITATPVNVSCNGGSNSAINVSVTGGIPGYTYLWNDNVTTLNRTGLTAGNYTLTVTDSKGCSAQKQVEITQPTAISISNLQQTNVNCFGGNNGAISYTVAGGTGGYTYLWNDGVTTQNRTSLAAGTYSVTVKDANNCTLNSGNIIITQPAAPLALSETHVNILCYGATTGSVDLTVTGGTTPYTYAWTGPGSFTATSEDISNRPAGTYNVTVTDSKGCTQTLSVTLTQNPALNITSTMVQPTCPPEATSSNSDGAITITVTGGSGTYTSYSWTGPGFTSTNQNISGLKSGVYTVTVTDSNGCQKSASFTLNYLKPILPPPGLITK